MRNGTILLSFAAILLFGGCSHEVAEHPVSSDPMLARQYRQGSAMLAVSLSETNIPTSGSIQLVLDVQVPPGIKVVFPEVGNAIDPFMISDGYAEPLQTLPNGKQRHRRVWTLVPALPGETVFQSMEIRAGTAHIATDPIAITTTSVLPPDLDVFEIKDIAAPIPLLPEQTRRRQLWKILLAGAVAVLLVLAIVRIRRPKPIIVLPPHHAWLAKEESLPQEKQMTTRKVNGS